MFICHIFFYPSTVKLLLSFYFNTSFIDSIWLDLGFLFLVLGVAFLSTLTISASYTQVLKLFIFNFIVALAGFVSPTLLFVSTCLFGVYEYVPLPLLFRFLFSYSITLYCTILYPLLASFSVAGSSNTYPGLIKGYLQSILYNSSHLTLYTFISSNLTISNFHFLLSTAYFPNTITLQQYFLISLTFFIIKIL